MCGAPFPSKIHEHIFGFILHHLPVSVNRFGKILPPWAGDIPQQKTPGESSSQGEVAGGGRPLQQAVPPQDGSLLFPGGLQLFPAVIAYFFLNLPQPAALGKGEGVLPGENDVVV